MSRIVAIASVQGFLIDPLRAYLNPNEMRWPDRRIIDRLSRPLIESLCDRFNCRSEPIVHGVGVHARGLDTVTWDDERSRHIGLHLDSWQSLPIHQRHSALLRININIGWSPRYFIFINLELQRMVDILRKYESCGLRQDPRAIGSAFIARFPEYPIIRIQIDPGEAYIAPTDNMIHDATTESATFIDYTFTVRGAFRLD